MECFLLGIFLKQFIMAGIAVVMGFFLARHPKKNIDMQAVLYRRGNWHLEPISMKKQIKKIRVLGAVVFILGVLSFIWIFCFIYWCNFI